MKIRHVSDYRAARREQYPPLADQVGDMWVVLEKLAATQPALAKALQESPTFQQVQAVKQRIRKPARS